MREGGPHTKVFKGNQCVTVPRHRDIAPGTTRSILKRAEKIGLIKRVAVAALVLLAIIVLFCAL